MAGHTATLSLDVIVILLVVVIVVVYCNSSRGKCGEQNYRAAGKDY